MNVFKPFDKVLVRDGDEEKWLPKFFSHIDDNIVTTGAKFVTIGNCTWKQCIPYKGNEHLVLTTNNNETFTFGDKVTVWDNDYKDSIEGIFVDYSTYKDTPYKVMAKGTHVKDLWKNCKSGWKYDS